MRLRAAVFVVTLSMGVAACAATTPDPQTSTAAPAPSAPTAAPSPTQADTTVPSPAPSFSIKPSKSPGLPKTLPPPPQAGPLKCSVSNSSSLPWAKGVGPAGSIAVTGNNEVALTFDDGPDPVNTPKLLDLLHQCGVKATFCVVGVKAEKNPGVIRRIHAEGHTLCNHTWHHGDTRKADDATVRWWLKHTNEVIRAIVPDAPIKYFRNPYGYFSEQTVRIAKELGMTSIYWHVDPKDWDFDRYGHGQRMVNHIVSAVQQQTRPGSIILSHDNLKPDTVTAYRTLLPWMKARFKLTALPNDPVLPNAGAR